ncbi:MAG: DUF4878 domain-containing protein [Succinivibrio sp.]
MRKFLASVMIFTASLVFLGCGSDEAPEDVAVRFTQNLYKADTKAAMAMIDFSQSGRADEKAFYEEVEGKFATILPQRKAEIEKKAGGVKSITAKAVQTDDTATSSKVDVEICFNGKYNGKECTIESVNLVKTGERWKVNLK